MKAKPVPVLVGAAQYTQRKEANPVLDPLGLMIRTGKLADMAMEIELSRLITYRGAVMADRGLHREMNLVAAYAKLYTSEAAMRTTAAPCKSWAAMAI